MDFIFGFICGVLVPFGFLVFLIEFKPVRLFKTFAKCEWDRLTYTEKSIRTAIKERKDRLDSLYRKLDELKNGLSGVSIDTLNDTTETFNELRAEIKNAHKAYDYIRGLAYVNELGREVDQFFSK